LVSDAVLVFVLVFVTSPHSKRNYAKAFAEVGKYLALPPTSCSRDLVRLPVPPARTGLYPGASASPGLEIGQVGGTGQGPGPFGGSSNAVPRRSGSMSSALTTSAVPVQSIAANRAEILNRSSSCWGTRRFKQVSAILDSTGDCCRGQRRMGPLRAGRKLRASSGCSAAQVKE
jgi:hypothetical protein